MIRLIAQYRIRPGAEDEVLTAISTFAASVHKAEPLTEYRAHRLTNTREFLHVMAFPDEAARDSHQEARYTRDFVAALYPKCEEPPVFTPIELIE